jgi:hypothetical protein
VSSGPTPALKRRAIFGRRSATLASHLRAIPPMKDLSQDCFVFPCRNVVCRVSREKELPGGSPKKGIHGSDTMKDQGRDCFVAAVLECCLSGLPREQVATAGALTIARRFSAGAARPKRGVPEGRLKGSARTGDQLWKICVVGDGGRGNFQQGIQVFFEAAPHCFINVLEAERLEASLRGPHGKQHFRLAAHGS